MFVLLEHTTPNGAHWDLMVEAPDREGLASWRLLADPTAGDAPVPAEAIGDHRRAYLEIEGDIGGGRGSVRRIDRGEAAIERSPETEVDIGSKPDAGVPARVLLTLHGQRLTGMYEFVELDGGKVFRLTKKH